MIMNKRRRSKMIRNKRRRSKMIRKKRRRSKIVRSKKRRSQMIRSKKCLLCFHLEGRLKYQQVHRRRERKMTNILQ